MDTRQTMLDRDCPVCGETSGTATLFLGETVDAGRITAASFASRKIPEYMSYRLVRCRACTAVFAKSAPGAEEIARAYHEADYGSAREAELAAEAYRKALAPAIAGLPRRGTALEIGTGTGIFLRHLGEMGFSAPVGIEPSPAAIAAAPPDVAPLIREGVFTGDEFPPGSVSLVCCFQTLEHIPDPAGFVRAAFGMLEPGGMLALVTHDYRAPVNRALGRWSPIVDIEHLQLFNRESLRRLVTDAGFGVERIVSFRNVYPLRYWASLFPMPSAMKAAVLSGLGGLGVAELPVGVNVGNLLTVAVKPAAARA